MLGKTLDENCENNILYELLIYAEWQQEPEIQNRGVGEKYEERNDSGKCSGDNWKWLGPFAPEPCPPLLVRQLINLQMPWTFAIGGNGAVIAVLQDSSLEIRSSRDEYGAVLGRTLVVSKDHCPQWRRILWSPDCSMLVLAHSNGCLDFYDLIGAHMFTIDSETPPLNNEKTDFGSAIASMAFSDVRVKNTQWSYEFIVANYQGIITGYFISPSDGFKESHKFSLSFCYPTGITCFAYHPTSNILLVCGKSHKLSLLPNTNEASQMGISAWRFISGHPFYKLTLSLEEQMAFNDKNWWPLLSYYRKYKSPVQDLVYKISISPGGNRLAAVHVSGAISIWDLPSLRLKKYYPLRLQPNFDDAHPRYREPGMKKKADPILSDPIHSHIVDINWWSNEAVILVRRCGSVTVLSINSLRNLLGISPEWFEPSPEVSSFCDRGFLIIEGETRVKSKRWAADEMENLDNDESSDDEDPSIFAKTAELAQRALYFITDNEKFQTPRKKVKMIVKTFRLLCLKSTTPEELYTRKINNEEYGEALALAKTYNLDCDLVYQRQWRKMPATVESIHDYLSKITKRSWVLHECIERVPENFEAAKELLLYGLHGTDLEALIAIGKGEDRGRFILCSPIDDDFSDDYNSSDLFSVYPYFEEMNESRREKEQNRRNEMLKQINFKKLTLEQKQLCQCRLKLLTYLDRLTTYEIILGGTLMAEDHYDHNFFKEFRSQCGLAAAVQFACNSNWQAIATLFTYHGSETLWHRLSILSNFPETTSPAEYQTLLPLFREKDLAFCPWDEHQLRESDWCEIKYQKLMATQSGQDFVDDFYDKHEELVKYRQQPLKNSVVTKWFIERAQEIEARSGLVENALDLVKLGIERNIKGLEKLYDNFLTLETVVYDCHVQKELSFKEFKELDEFDKIKLIMSKTNEDKFIKNIRQWLLPFLNRCEKHVPGTAKSLLEKYILSISNEDLTYCLKILENSKPDASPIIYDVEEMISLALDCIYSCERDNQLKNANAIIGLLSSMQPQSSGNYGRKLSSLLQNIEKLKKHICVAELLEKNKTSVTLALLQNVSNNPVEVRKLLTKLTRTASRRSPVLDEAKWMSLLSDILEMQQLLFSCLIQEDCYEIVLHSLLCSGKQEGISLAGKMMECNNKQRKNKPINFQQFKLPYMHSVNLILVASREYFNSSASSADPCMALARSCLNLIEDVPTSIVEELDLISSLALLQEFNVNILPLQVRLCENKISIIQQALQNTKKAYTKPQKVMKLANLLRAWSSNQCEREGKILTLIGEHAFQAKDYEACFSACKNLMERGYKDGWFVSFVLGGCEDFNDIPARSDLMSFALAHCSEDLMETILESKSKLQLQILHDRVKFLMGDNAVQLDVMECSGETIDKVSLGNMMAIDEGLTALWQTGGKTLEVLQNTTKTTKAVLTSVGSTQFWKDAVNWIQPLALWNEECGDTLQENNKSVNKQGICAFYSSLVENAHISSLEASYQRFARPDLNQSSEISTCVLRACLLGDSLKCESQKSSVSDTVLLDLAKAYFPEDVTLSLSFLLGLSKEEEADILFQTLPCTPIVLHLASLYYAIRICMNGNLQDTLLANDYFQADPSVLIRKVVDLKYTSRTSETKNSNVCTLSTLLNKYNKMLYDFIQAEILHRIGGVDATRFTTDDVYKKDTILGIAMTLDDSVFHISVTLAHHYNLPLWDLYMTHLEYLFSESSTSTAVINGRIEKLKILENLLRKPDAFRERMTNFVYANIDGKDHEKLVLFFSLLELCGDKDDGLQVAPSVHKKLLTKFRSSAKSLDYKALMKPGSSDSYLTTLLNESNVYIFAKAASKIPKENGTFFEPGNIYCLWVKKFFFDGNASNSKVPATKTEWIHRYESCTDMLQRLAPTDILEFIDSVAFTEKAFEKLSVDSRAEIVKRALRFCRQKCSRHKDDPELNSQWNSTITSLTLYQQHLQRMEDEILVQLKDSLDPKIQTYCKEFDLSRSAADSLHHLLTKIVIEGPDLQLLKTVLSCCPADVGWEPTDAYIEAINIILNQMKHSQDVSYRYLKTHLPIVILESILEDISKNREELMIEDVAVELLNQFCQDSAVSVSIRLSILQLLEKTNCLSDEYSELLLLYRTQAVVTSMWADMEVSEEEVRDPHCRKMLFGNLIALSETVDHFNSLAKLLNQWPPFPPQQTSHDEPWTKVMCGLIQLRKRDGLDLATNILEKALSFSSFTKQCCQDVFNKIKDQGSVFHTMKYAFKSNQESLYKEALDILKDTPEISNEDYDDELLDLILQHSLTAQIVSTSLYKPVIGFLLQCQETCNTEESHKSVDVVAKELSDAGHVAEAGSLLLVKHSTHTGLFTFSSAFHIFQRLYANNL